jgi:hypothetical protein
MRARTLATVVQCGWMLTIATLLLSLYAKQSKAQPTSNSPVGTNKTPGSTGQQGHSGKAPGSTGQQSKAGTSKAPGSTSNWGGAYLGPGSTGQSPGGASRAPRNPTNKSR